MSQQTVVTPEQTPPEQQSAIAISTGGAAGQYTMRNIGLITRYEYRRRITQRSFIISTIIILVLIIIAAFVPTIIRFITAHSSNAQTKVAVVNKAGSIGGLSGDTLASFINKSLNGTTGSTTGQSASGNGQFVISTASPSSIDSL